MADIKPLDHINRPPVPKPMVAPAKATIPAPIKCAPEPDPKLKNNLYRECIWVLRRAGCPQAGGEGWKFIIKLAMKLNNKERLGKNESAALVIATYRDKPWDGRVLTRDEVKTLKKAKKIGKPKMDLPRERHLFIKKNPMADKKPAVEFYQSPAWRQLRYEALAASDGKCQLCGRGKKDGVILHVDHIRPRSKFPKLELDPTNLQVLCEDCNMGKMNRDDRDWRETA